MTEYRLTVEFVCEGKTKEEARENLNYCLLPNPKTGTALVHNIVKIEEVK